jgi:hypothetical protein
MGIVLHLKQHRLQRLGYIIYQALVAEQIHSRLVVQ